MATSRVYPVERVDPFTSPPELIELSRSGPVQKVLLQGDIEAWLVSGYREAREVLTRSSFSADSERPGFPDVGPARKAGNRPARPFTRMDPPEHTLYRRSLAAEFSPRRIEALRPYIQSTVAERLDQFAAQGSPADLVSGFARPISSAVISKLLGVPYEYHERFERCTGVIIDWTSSAEASQAALSELMSIVMQVVQTRLDTPGDDLISRMLHESLPSGRPFTPEQTVVTSLSLLGAGHETTATMISLSVLTLLAKLDAEERRRTTETRLEQVVDELLRYHSILHFGLPRVAAEDTMLGGIEIAAGDALIVSLQLANRDQELVGLGGFDDIDFDRNRCPHLAFGHGVHVCLGYQLAKTEIEIAIRQLFARLPGLELHEKIDSIPCKKQSLVYGVDRLLVSW